MKRIELEYQLKTSPTVLFARLSTPSGLAEWFADNVLVEGNKYDFVWGKTHQTAELLGIVPMESVSFRWLDSDEQSHFEFRVVRGEIVEDISLVITDSVDDEDQEDSSKLWDAAVTRLKKAIGS